MKQPVPALEDSRAQFLTPTEAARVLGVTRPRVYQLITRGVLSSSITRVAAPGGTRHAIALRDVERYRVARDAWLSAHGRAGSARDRRL